MLLKNILEKYFCHSFGCDSNQQSPHLIIPKKGPIHKSPANHFMNQTLAPDPLWHWPPSLETQTNPQWRREVYKCMEWLGVWNCVDRSLKFGANRSFCRISGIFLQISASESCFQTLENGHSIRHQPIPTLSSGRAVDRKCPKRKKFFKKLRAHFAIILQKIGKRAEYCFESTVLEERTH